MHIFTQFQTYLTFYKIDGSSAEYIRDCKIVFSYFESSIEENTSRVWLESNDNRKNYDGHGVWEQLKQIGKGNDNR